MRRITTLFRALAESPSSRGSPSPKLLVKRSIGSTGSGLRERISFPEIRICRSGCRWRGIMVCRFVCSIGRANRSLHFISLPGNNNGTTAAVYAESFSRHIDIESERDPFIVRKVGKFQPPRSIARMASQASALTIHPGGERSGSPIHPLDSARSRESYQNMPVGFDLSCRIRWLIMSCQGAHCHMPACHFLCISCLQRQKRQDFRTFTERIRVYRDANSTSRERRC